MTHRHLPHAQAVITRFKQMLNAEQQQCLGDEHLDELSLMIESAISTAVLEEAEHSADAIIKLAESLRRRAEHL